jgi:hypothetical protein
LHTRTDPIKNASNDGVIIELQQRERERGGREREREMGRDGGKGEEATGN